MNKATKSLKLFRHPPTSTYKGLTIVMSNPSRYDIAHLLSGPGGNYFERECLYPHMTRNQCDIRLAIDRTPLLPGTKCVLLLGDLAQRTWAKVTTSLGEQRGSPMIDDITGMVYISSYLPQEAVDPKNHELTNNPYLNGEHASDDDDDDDDAQSEKSKHGKTKKRNWAFWLKQDVRKAMRIVKNDGKLPSLTEHTMTYKAYSPAGELINILTNTKGKLMFIDIETDTDLNILCIGFSFGLDQPVYVFPVLRFNYTIAYAKLSKIFRALAVAFRDNTVVAHNGSTFDFFVFAYKYKIPISRNVIDTMLVQHRIFPESEKSLGHCIAQWTYEKFHKNEGIFSPRNDVQEQQLWHYNGKDVWTMMLIYQEQMKYAKTIPGLVQSINQANASIRPYLIMMLQGIRFDEQQRAATLRENDRLMTQYLRCINILVGVDILKAIKPKTSKSNKPLPLSNAQCVNYFHKVLEYPVVKKSKKTGNPSLDKQAIYKLKLKHSNPVLDLIINFRELATESGFLKFTPWKP